MKFFHSTPGNKVKNANITVERKLRKKKGGGRIISLDELPSSLANIATNLQVRSVPGQLRHLHAHSSTDLRREDQTVFSHSAIREFHLTSLIRKHLPLLLVASRLLRLVFPQEMDSPDAGKPDQNIYEKHLSGFFWLPSHRTLCISNCSKPVSQEPAREQDEGARILVVSRRAPGGLPGNREFREVSEKAARGWGKCLSETCQNVFCRMFSFWQINSFGTEKNSNKFFIASVLDPSLHFSQLDPCCLSSLACLSLSFVSSLLQDLNSRLVILIQLALVSNPLGFFFLFPILLTR